MLFIVGIGVVLGVVSGSFMLAVIFVIRHRYEKNTAFILHRLFRQQCNVLDRLERQTAVMAYML